MTLDILGIRDLFLIRNHIFAHAPERTTIGASNRSLITKINYLKFKDFPSFYPEFGTEHFEKLLSEVRGFLMNYLSLMSGKLPD